MQYVVDNYKKLFKIKILKFLIIKLIKIYIHNILDWLLEILNKLMQIHFYKIFIINLI